MTETFFQWIAMLVFELSGLIKNLAARLDAAAGALADE
jgi:hypothetical protein